MPVNNDKFNALLEAVNGRESELPENDHAGTDDAFDADALEEAIGYGADAVLQNVEKYIKKGAPSPIPGMKMDQRFGLAVSAAERMGGEVSGNLKKAAAKLASTWKNGKGDISKNQEEDGIRAYFILGAIRDLSHYLVTIT